MKQVNGVRGCIQNAIPLTIGKTTVYIRYNIHKIENENEEDPTEYYEWDETQYTKDEYLEYLSHQNEQLQADLDYLAIMMEVDINV